MKYTIQSSHSKTITSCYSKFYFVKIGGGATMLLLFFVSTLLGRLNAQVPPPSCTPFYFEVCKVLPVLNSYPPNPNNPGAFQAYYKVKLKIQPNLPNQSVLPPSWNFNYLAFSGKISVNGFTSRINIEQTILFSKSIGGNPNNPNPYYGPPNTPYLTVSESGEVAWVVGTPDNCTGGEQGVTLPFPLQQTEVELFTIVVDGVPSDVVNFNNLSAEVKDCKTYGCPNGVMTVQGCPGQISYLIGFTAPPVCNPAKTVSFELTQIQNNYLISVKLNNLTPGIANQKCDMVIHILPQMNGINNLQLIPVKAGLGPNILHWEKAQNTDGSFDIYVNVSGFASVTGTETLFLIQVNGQFNLSQGASLACSMPIGRGYFPQGGGVSTICTLSSTNANLIIPGYSACANILNVSPTRYVGPNCSLGVRYTITHNGSGPINLSSLKLFFALKLNGNNLPGTVTSTLPCSSCGNLTYNPNNSFWEYHYDQNTPLSLANGAEVIIPFNVNTDCVQYYVIMAEALPLIGGTCALGVTFDTNQWPACDPAVHGSILLDHTTFVEPAPFYKVTLESQIDPNYHISNPEDCEDEYSFCPDATKAPFQLRAEFSAANYLCGVTTYDLVLISKHIFGIQMLPYPRTMIAGDAQLKDATDPFSINGITINDVVAIRKCILGITPNFGSLGAPSWWYFRDNYMYMPSPTPFNPPYTSSNIAPVPSNTSGGYGNFFAVKVGDVNQTCVCGIQRPAALKDAKPFFKAFESKEKSASGFVSVPIWSNAPFDLIAAQAGLRFDPSVYSLKEIVPNSELPISEVNFGRTKAQDGELLFAWSPFDGQTPLPKNTLLFTLVFELKNHNAIAESPICWTSDKVLESLVYKEDGEEFNARLNWDGNNSVGKEALNFKVSPNPFQDKLSGFIFSEHSGTATVSLADSKGNIYSQETIELQIGETQVEMNTIVTAQPGVYFLTLIFEGQRLQKRIVKLKM